MNEHSFVNIVEPTVPNNYMFEIPFLTCRRHSSSVTYVYMYISIIKGKCVKMPIRNQQTMTQSLMNKFIKLNVLPIIGSTTLTTILYLTIISALY